MKKIEHTTNILKIVIVFTLIAGVADNFIPDIKTGDNFFAVMAEMGIAGCMIAFFTALVVAFKADCPEEEEADEDS